MGIGKSTAIRSLCGAEAVDCVVPNLDAQHEKAFTTVGADYGVLELTEGQQLHLYGAPGQARFAFLREWLLEFAIGVIVMCDVHARDALEETATLLQECSHSERSLVCIVLVARPATEDALDAFSVALAQRVGWPVPLLLTDVREAEAMRDVLATLVSMLSVDLQPLETAPPSHA